MRLKCLICNFNNTTVHTVFSSTSKFETLIVEQALIDAYGDNLVNKRNVYQVVS